MQQKDAYLFRMRGASPRPSWQQWLILLFGAAFLLGLVILAGFLALLLLPVILLLAWLARRRLRRAVGEAEERRRQEARTIEGDYRSLD